MICHKKENDPFINESFLYHMMRIEESNNGLFKRTYRMNYVRDKLTLLKLTKSKSKYDILFLSYPPEINNSISHPSEGCIYTYPGLFRYFFK